MNALRGIPAVVRFEWQRSRTLPRMAWWLLLTAFPPALVGLVRWNVGRPPADQLWTVHLLLFVLCPSVVCMLGVFLWAAPWLSSELEGRSWVYVAVRPQGVWAAMFGKYLVAVTWTIPAGCAASALAALIFSPGQWGQLVWVQWRLVLLACLSYGAIFTLIGVLFPKRAMVSGVFYTIVFEFGLASIPAAVNLLTVQYRLRCLLVRWSGMDHADVGEIPVFQAYFGDEPAAWHAGMLLLMTAALLLAAAAVLRCREFTADAESGW